MTLNGVKNLCITGLLLLLLGTALFGVRSIKQLVHTLVINVEFRNPAQTNVVTLTERLRTTSDRFNAFVHRDRVSAEDVEGALRQLEQRFELLAGTQPLSGIDVDLSAAAASRRAFVHYVEEVESTDAQSDAAVQQLDRVLHNLVQTGSSLANLAEATAQPAAPEALGVMVTAASSALAESELAVDRFMRRDAVTFDDVLHPISESLKLLDELLALEDTQRRTYPELSSNSDSAVSPHALSRLREAVVHARAALFNYADEDNYDPDVIPSPEVERQVREAFGEVTVALLRVNKQLGRESENAQRASIADGARWKEEYIWLSAVAMGLAVFISMALGRYLNIRLGPLRDGATRFSDGELSHRIEAGPRDALGDLGRAFNRMANRLERKEQDLVARLEELDQANQNVRISNAYLDGLIDSIPEAMVVLDAKRRVTRTNPALRMLTGYEESELSGLALSSLFITDPGIELVAGDNVMVGVEANLLTSKGTLVPVNVSVAYMAPEDAHAGGTIIVAQDVRSAKWAERRRSMKYAVTRVLVEADDLGAAMPEILRICGEAMDYACGSYWRWNDASELLLHDCSWGAGTDEIETFLACQTTNDPKSSGGLIRRTWGTGDFVWIDDVSADSAFKRAPFAHKAGLRGGLAVPVWDGTRTYGVFELFSHDTQAPEPELVEDIQTIGGQIGQFCRRRGTELALHEKTKHLERSNRELDQFAYVTSHDLKAPLRAIANLSSWIEEDLGEDLGDEPRENMKLLRGRVHRMENLIQGILEYSRIGREAVSDESVDLSQLLGDIVDSLPVPPQFQINLPPQLPVLTAPKVRLFQVFSNLIGNAIKYHDRDDGRVDMTVSNGGHWYEFVVEDDGPGIPNEYHDKVFGIFQTLEARDKVESTGIGLTLVKKIVEEQGGFIEIAKHDGRGARFRFTWPAQEGAR